MSTLVRTIEPSVSLFTAAEVQVALLPIGHVPKDVLDDYTDLINKYKHISLSATRSFYKQSSQRSPLQYLPWNTGYVHFKFLMASDVKRQSRLTDLQRHRQVLAVIGIVHCPSSRDLKAAYAEFHEGSKQFGDAFVRRCFAFEPSEEQLRSDGPQQADDMVVFPPGGLNHLEQHMEVWMYDLGALVITEVENWLQESKVTSIKLNTFVDSSDFTGQMGVMDEVQKLITDEEVREKRRWARFMKAKGDYCLLAGSFQDALEHYRSCLDLARAGSDMVFYGSALEAMASCRMVEALTTAAAMGNNSEGRGSRRGQGESKSAVPGFGTPAMWQILRKTNLEIEIRELMAEARAVYKKRGGVPTLQIEQHLKLCRLLSGLHGPAARREVGEMAAMVVEIAQGLSVIEDRLLANVEAAQVLGLVGYQRRRLLHLWSGADLARSMDKSTGHALKTFVRALEPYVLTQNQGLDGSARGHWWVSGRAPCSWPVITAALLEGALIAAKQAGSHEDVWEVAAALLRDHAFGRTPAQQESLLALLSTASAGLSPRGKVRLGTGPGPILALRRVLPPPAPLVPCRLEGWKLGGGVSNSALNKNLSGLSPFIFNPYAAKRQAKAAADSCVGPEWVVGEECRVEVVVINPLSTPLHIDRLLLHATLQPTSPLLEHQTSHCNGTADGSGCTTPLGGGGSLSNRTSGTNQGKVTASSSLNTLATTSSYTKGAMPPITWSSDPVEVVVPGGGRPVRLVLAGKALVPGNFTLTGCMVSKWSVSWLRPFSSFYRKGPHIPAPGSVEKESTSATSYSLCTPPRITVIPPLPLLRTQLVGHEILATVPSDADLHCPTAVSPPGESLRSWPALVMEGQVACWTLVLTNIGSLAVSSAAVAVTRPRGAALRPRPTGVLGASFVGAHMEVDGGKLVKALPLLPGASVEVPVTVRVGKPPSRLFEDVILEMHVSYTSDTADASIATDPETSPLGRTSTLNISFHVAPSLSVIGITFLDLPLPLRDGSRLPLTPRGALGTNPEVEEGAGATKPSGPRPLLLSPPSINSSRQFSDSALARLVGLDLNVRIGGGLDSNRVSLAGSGRFSAFKSATSTHQVLRQSLDEILTGPAALLQLPPKPEPLQAYSSRISISSSSDCESPNAPEELSHKVHTLRLEEGGITHVPPANNGSTLTWQLSMRTECTLEVTVSNSSDRYFRAWLLPVTDDDMSPMKANMSTNTMEVLQPGDMAVLCAVMESSNHSHSHPPHTHIVHSTTIAAAMSMPNIVREPGVPGPPSAYTANAGVGVSGARSMKINVPGKQELRGTGWLESERHRARDGEVLTGEEVGVNPGGVSSAVDDGEVLPQGISTGRGSGVEAVSSGQGLQEYGGASPRLPSYQEDDSRNMAAVNDSLEDEFSEFTGATTSDSSALTINPDGIPSAFEHVSTDLKSVPTTESPDLGRGQILDCDLMITTSSSTDKDGPGTVSSVTFSPHVHSVSVFAGGASGVNPPQNSPSVPAEPMRARASGSVITNAPASNPSSPIHSWSSAPGHHSDSRPSSNSGLGHNPSVPSHLPRPSRLASSSSADASKSLLVGSANIGSGSYGSIEVESEPNRMWSAETVAARWAVGWELITGEPGSEDSAPRGMMRLSAVDIARSLSPAAVAALVPPPLRLSFFLDLPNPGVSSGLRPLSGGGAGAAGCTASAWGLAVRACQPINFHLLITNRSQAPMQITFSIGCTSMDSTENRSTTSTHPTQPKGRASSLDNPTSALASSPALPPETSGALLLGHVEGIVLNVGPGETGSHPFSLLLFMPGKYQLLASDVSVAGQTARPYYLVDRFNIVCTS